MTQFENRFEEWLITQDTMFLENELASRREESSAAKQTLLERRLQGLVKGSPRTSSIPRRSGQNHVPLSFTQQRLWFLDQLHPESPVYNFPIALRLRGPLNVEALQHAFRAIVTRHEALRTRFVSMEGNPVQVISEPLAVELPLADLTQMVPALREAEVQRLAMAEARRPFNLSKDLMLRVLLLKLEPAEHILVVTIHHIATDAWSMGILFRELAAFYGAFIGGQKPSLAELPIQYSDFAVWQREWLQGEVVQKQLRYWKQRLAGAREFLELPTDRPRPAAQMFRGATQKFILPEGVSGALKQLSRREGVTLFMTLLAAFKTLLYRYSKQEDILVGSPIAGRNRLETEESIGFFINTLVLRTDLSGNPTFKELLPRVREVALGAFAHQDMPFDKLVEELHPERNAGHAPLVQVMFVLQNASTQDVKLPQLTVTPLEITNEASKFDLTLFMEESPQGFVASFEYSVHLFDDATITRMGGHFQSLLEGITANVEQRLSELPLLTAAERQQLVVEWNNTGTDYPAGKCVHQLFEEQAAQTPPAVAVQFGEKQLTYAELNERANQLAHYLKKKGVERGMAVGMFMERSLEMVVGLLGILKAGGAYASLDPASPKERLAHMLEDLGATVLLTQKKLTGLLPTAVEKPANIIKLDDAWPIIAQESKADPACETDSESLAYVSFTSGSTGRPKGVCVPHRGVTRLVRNTNYASFSSADVFLQLAPISFDASTLEIWGCLLNGAKLVVYPPQTPSLSELGEAIQRHHITTLWLTSGLFNQLVEEKLDSLKNVRQILTGGDVLSVPHVKKAVSALAGCRLINGYGPTENTTFTACHAVPVSFSGERSVPIGRPVSNTQCYVLDEGMQPVPIGVPGELYAGGEGLALGYLNRPELTLEKFVPHPFDKKPGARLYKTGDLVRHLPDGNLEFLGRIDMQVKIRGFRIELGEVESVLGRHPLIRDCTVIVREDGPGGKQLVAYFVPHRRPGPSVTELRRFLSEKLPEYMTPGAFVEMETLPLTPNGKVDRRALPAPDKGRPDLERKYVGPKDAIESELVAIWENVLGIQPIGMEDKFFDLGGHSLLAVRLLAQVEKKFERKLPLSVVFQAPTVGQMAGYLRDEKTLTLGSSLVEIQPKGGKPPLYFVHGVGGGMFWGYTNLSRSLGTDQPLYALKSRSMDGQEEFATIEEMAAQYVADIRAFQTKGPYHLGGYCFGGNVAYEMARQLTARGEKVALLVVLNCAPPNTSYSKIRWTPAFTIKFLRNLGYLVGRSLGWGAQQRNEFLRWKAALIKRRMVRFFKLAREKREQLHVEDMVDLSAFPKDQRDLWEKHIRALIKFFPKRYAGKVTLFRSRGHPLFCSYDEQYGWGELAREVETYVIPGAHESILEEPHVRDLAENIKECLLKIQKMETATANPAPTVSEESRIGSSLPASWHETREDYPQDLCVHQLFEEQVKRSPEAMAVEFKGRQLTYGEVNRLANQIAHHLQSLGVGPDVPVGICLERSIELVVGLLGILKAGGAYVPLDPAYPKERLSLMLENSQAPVLITQQKLLAGLPVNQGHVVCIDHPLPTASMEQNPAAKATPDSLAYVIYTSGSTGKPKGVAMGHRPLVNLIWWQLKNSTLGKGDKTLQFASSSFDVSFQEIFSTWCSGGMLMLIDEELRHDPPKLLGFIQEQQIKRLFLPFIALHQLAESVSEKDTVPDSLREVITAGEQLRITGKIASLFERLKTCALHNHYGPSESHVVTAFTLEGEPAGWPPLPPIGRPIANTQIHLLDEKLNPVPKGEPGELYIGGICLARGYLHQPQLTAERFIDDPFALETGSRLYKTGDLAKYLPDGNIEFLGRIDHQVKIRGYRIELSEIETVLGRYEGVRECAVAAREDVPGQKRLVAYVVNQPNQKVTVGDLRRFLLEKLPDYMVPSAYVFLDALPLTPSGKVNRLNLPAPDQGRPDLEEQYVAPRNPIEESIAAIWCEVLNLKRAGVRDNFFELGGHSLLVAQVVSRIREKFKIELPFFSLFDAPTVEALVEGIETGRWNEGQKAVPPIKALARNGNPPLSFAQTRLWFIDRLEPGSHAYNVPMAVRLKGPLKLMALQHSLNRIVRRHETLRTTIAFADGNLTQVIAPELKVSLRLVNLRGMPETDREDQTRKVIEEESQRPFDLERGPLLRCKLIILDEQEHILLVVMHHIISDGWSLAVFFNELDLFYNALATGKTSVTLPELPVQYADYARWQQEWMRGEVLEQEVAYWKAKLKDAPALLDLPRDNDVENEAKSHCTQLAMLLPKSLTESIQTLGRREGITPFMALMAGLSLTLSKWTGQTDMVIGTVVGGRHHREIENLVGCFMNFVPVRTRIDEAKTARESLLLMKSTLIEMQAHQECPFEKIVEALNPDRKLSRNPLYNVAFLLQNFPAGTLNGGTLKATFMPVELQTALLDLRFIAEETADGISIACEYKTSMFEQVTIGYLLNFYRTVLEWLTAEPGKKIAQLEQSAELAALAKAGKARSNRYTIAVAATFTAEPVEESLKYWMKELEMPGTIEFAPYNQVFQQLLDPASLLSGNQTGINAIFVRMEDWEKFEGEEAHSAMGGQERVKRNVNELVDALKAATNRHATPYLICFCPPSPGVKADPARRVFHEQMESGIVAELQSLTGVYVVGVKEMENLYPVDDYYDSQTEELGQVPYTPLFFTALGTMVVRKLHALKRQPHKVIVLDCDQTLWGGVCGEDGAGGIVLDSPRQALQEFMRAQADAGILLCICSKNNEEDVNCVFEQRQEMPLKKEHFTAARINWLPKSENLKSLAGELRLGLDSFIFVDDNPVECAEVESNCPEVLTLQLPDNPGQIPQFLKHCWVFDHLKL
jgi:amino acid adenylation domain-containing protein/HAD superfamily phosphatase (TIGR01681 family)